MSRFTGMPSPSGLTDPKNMVGIVVSMAKEHQGKIGTLLQASIIGQSIYGQAKGMYDQWQEGREHVVAIGSFDPLYADVQRWVMSLMAERDKRYLTISSVHRYGRNHPLSHMDEEKDDTAPRVSYFYDGRVASKISLNGHRVDVSVELAANGDDTAGFHRGAEKRLVMRVNSIAARNALTNEIDRLSIQREIPEQPMVMMATQYGNWEHAHSLQSRDPKTVILKEGQFDRLSNDLGRFLLSEREYARIGMPWHRGYLLVGPAGTGKTSTALALANVHKLDIYYMSLTDIKSDVDILQLVGGIPNRSMLLLEDIDVSQAATGEREDTGKLTADGLLNALDGVMTPNGLVVVMTTNFVERLDSALVRPGRCDMIETIDVLTTDQAEALALAMTGRVVSLPPVEGLSITAASITEVVKRNIFDMDAAAIAIRAYVLEVEMNAAAVGVA